MSAHTKEPWVTHHSQPTLILANGERKHVGNTDSMGGRVENEANARRIVACVNACADMPTEEIEADIAVGGYKSIIDCHQAHVAEVEKQRNELLAVCVKARYIIGNRLDFDRRVDDDIDFIDAAIEKVGADNTAEAV